MDLVSISFLVGFFGDLTLQIASPRIGGPTGWGLTPYFKQHGKAESLFIAGGMMALFFIIYLYIFRLKPNYLYLAIYGIILDLLFRWFRIFPSLDGYYEYLNYFWSGFWQAFSMILPLLVSQFILGCKSFSFHP
jgi:hypothetical protein